MLNQSSLSRSPAPSTAVVVDANLATAFRSACEQGDIDACHLTLLKLQQHHPRSVAEDLHPSERRSFQPLYELVGEGFTITATHGHVAMIEFLLSSHFASALRDGICSDRERFPPFATLRNHELVRCVGAIRFVCFAALACIDLLAMPVLQFLAVSHVLWDHEASLCLTLAMRRAVAVAMSDSTGSLSPAAFHPMIVLLATHYDFLIDEVRDFHKKFPTGAGDMEALDRVKALQASLLYEIILDG